LPVFIKSELYLARLLRQAGSGKKKAGRKKFYILNGAGLWKRPANKVKNFFSPRLLFAFFQ